MEARVQSRAKCTLTMQVRRKGLLPIEGGAPGVVFTQFGEEWVADVLNGLAPGTQYIHWGTGAAVPSKGSTNVSTPGTEARVAAVRAEATADKLQWTATIVANGTKTITNAGLFKAGTLGVGDGIIIGDHTSQAVNSGDEIDYTITLEMT